MALLLGVRDVDQDEFRFHVDGELEVTTLFPEAVSIRDPDSFLGTMQHYRNRNLKADLDDVRPFGRALSTDEIASLYDIAEWSPFILIRFPTDFLRHD